MFSYNMTGEWQVAAVANTTANTNAASAAGGGGCGSE